MGALLIAAACSGGGGDGRVEVRVLGAGTGEGTIVILDGGEDLQTENDLVADPPALSDNQPTPTTRQSAPSTSAEATPTDEPPPDTIPLNEDEGSATEGLVDSFTVFRTCLENRGASFIGAPNPALGPNDPVNDEGYIEHLVACAAESNIQEALAESQTEQANLTPEEIEQQNFGFLAFRDCMIERGWDMPEPVPDENGSLVGFGTDGGNGLGEPPPGVDPFNSPDIDDCSEVATEAVEDEFGVS